MMDKFNRHKFMVITVLIFWPLSYLFAGIEDQMPRSPDLQPKPNSAGSRTNLEYTSEGLRDPFQNYLKDKQAAAVLAPQISVEPEKPLPSFSVQGIIWGGRMPQAIISNTVLKKGDTIEGAVIKDINKDGVKVFFNDREYDLPSPGSSQNTEHGSQEQGLKNVMP